MQVLSKQTLLAQKCVRVCVGGWESAAKLVERRAQTGFLAQPDTSGSDVLWQ